MLWTLLKELHKVQAIETMYGREGSKWDSSCISEEDNNNGGSACVGLMCHVQSLENNITLMPLVPLTMFHPCVINVIYVSPFFHT
jgi:hypothetical protein